MADSDIVIEAGDSIWLPIWVMDEMWRRAIPSPEEPITWGEILSRPGVTIERRDDGKEQD